MIKGINHIGVAVKSIEAAQAFFEEAFGMKLAQTETEPGQRVVVAFLSAEGQKPGTEGVAEVELIEPVDEDGPVARFLASRGEGLHHICFEVTDIYEVIARLQDMGIQMVDDVPRLGTGGKRVAFLHPKAAHSVLIELYERRPDEPFIPLVDLDDLRRRALVESQAARAALGGFVSALQQGREKEGSGKGKAGESKKPRKRSGPNKVRGRKPG